MNRSVLARIGLLKKYSHRFVPPCDEYSNIPFLSEWRWFCLRVIRVRKSTYGCRYVCRDGYGYHRWANFASTPRHVTPLPSRRRRRLNPFRFGIIVKFVIEQ